MPSAEVLPAENLVLREPVSRHVEHGQTRLDNNLAENIRPTGVGKKNWLSIGHPEAGRRAVILYSLIFSCLRHGKDPAAYLRDVHSRLPAMTNQDDLDALTPRRWQPASPSASFRSPIRGRLASSFSRQ